MVYWYILWFIGIFFHFGIFYGFWYIFPLWYVVPRKIWQPCLGGGGILHVEDEDVANDEESVQQQQGLHVKSWPGDRVTRFGEFFNIGRLVVYFGQVF
jgi:hypothetical protein